ncbi:hypothetical protein ACJ2A9_21485 [Anaerobacillus sp. MEB173]|uniref:hypothetical protein n=1 Tax=Anaerobacillus sp. MEB173 TaxID=3383345 RepID=UPI003F926E4B
MNKEFVSKRELSQGELFYMINHIDVLGVDRGCLQISHRLNMDPIHIKYKYFEEKEKGLKHGSVRGRSVNKNIINIV